MWTRRRTAACAALLTPPKSPQRPPPESIQLYAAAAPDPAPSLIEQEDGASTSTSSRDGGTDSDTDAEILMHSVGRGPRDQGRTAERLHHRAFAALPRDQAIRVQLHTARGERESGHGFVLFAKLEYAKNRPRRHMLVWSLMSGSESDDVSPKEKTERLPAFQEHSPVYRGADLDAERTKVAIIQFALATICGEYLDDRCVLADMHDALADERCRVCRVEELEAAPKPSAGVELRLGESSARGVRAGNASAEAVQYATQRNLVAAQLNTLSAGHADQLREIVARILV
ncbi:hypothetical protein BD626DRAFT_576934 [Schizophyllum amplum]|uniref:Uncharacterized protein n=1 Tax=Schizophyllum amplum TaxID=97359 RepID=A0A550BSY7_9AGAR|nr:hypothetical protein BD626DRAFT_576934 [Auriculariopsis ampla]